MMKLLEQPRTSQDYHIPLPKHSTKPSTKSSATPSAKPSATPSTKLSTKPSTMPSTKPSAKPSAKPSTKPSATPSTKPSATPSARPSTKPSTKPCATPSTMPSTKPSTKPNATPSTKPSTKPYAKPRATPSATPSTKLRTNPSATPSDEPNVKAQKGLLFGVADGKFAAEDLQHFSENFPSTEAAALHLIAETEEMPDEIPVKETAGKYIANTKCHPALPTHQPEEDTAEKHRGLMWPRGIAWEHEAAPLLYLYSTEGCPVDCGPAWSKKQILAAIKRGAHISAKDPEARKYLINTTHDAVAGGFARLVQLKDIIDNLPPNLKVSPIAMIPHKSRAY